MLVWYYRDQQSWSMDYGGPQEVFLRVGHAFPRTVPASRYGCAPVELDAALALTFIASLEAAKAYGSLRVSSATPGTVAHTIRLEYHEGIIAGLTALKEYLC